MAKKKINMEELHKQYFKLYPKKRVLYFTEDGNCFLQKSPAVDHARKSKQKWTSVDNPVFIKQIESESQKGKKAEKTARLKAGLLTLKDWNPEQTDYRQDYDLATDLQLPLENKEHATVLAALKAAQENLTAKDQ